MLPVKPEVSLFDEWRRNIKESSEKNLHILNMWFCYSLRLSLCKEVWIKFRGIKKRQANKYTKKDWKGQQKGWLFFPHILLKMIQLHVIFVIFSRALLAVGLSAQRVRWGFISNLGVFRVLGLLTYPPSGKLKSHPWAGRWPLSTPPAHTHTRTVKHSLTHSQWKKGCTWQRNPMVLEQDPIKSAWVCLSRNQDTRSAAAAQPIALYLCVCVIYSCTRLLEHLVAGITQLYRLYLEWSKGEQVAVLSLGLGSS